MVNDDIQYLIDEALARGDSYARFDMEIAADYDSTSLAILVSIMAIQSDYLARVASVCEEAEQADEFLFYGEEIIELLRLSREILDKAIALAAPSSADVAESAESTDSMRTAV